MAIVFSCAERKVAIEFDRDSHFLKAALGSGELTPWRNGSTKAKRQRLEQLGWTVINLDYRDYIDACRKSKQAGVTLPYCQ